MEAISGEDSSIVASVLTVAEVLSGEDCSETAIRTQIGEFFAPVEKLDVDMDIARKGAEFRRVYGIPLVDALIAATAFRLNVPLYSRNKKDFGRIKEIRLVVPY